MSVGLTSNEGSVCVHVPMMLKRRSGRKEIVVPDGLEHSEDTGPDYHEALVIAISRAHRWKKLLDDGRYRSINDMANKLHVNNAYMRRLLRFTLLAPDIVEAILAGSEPEGFSQNKLVEAIPPGWDEQRKLYCFAERQP